MAGQRRGSTGGSGPPARSLRAQAHTHTNALWNEDPGLWRSAKFRRGIYGRVDSMNRAELQRLLEFRSLADWGEAAADEDGVYADNPEDNPFLYH